MPLSPPNAYARQKICVDFASLKYACPKGVYVAPVPDEPLLWTGLLFVRKGPYANAILRFQIAFPNAFPSQAPVITLLTDVFHPLVAPLTTYTYTTRDKGNDPISSADKDKLPPGGLSLRHGFPEWFGDDSPVPLDASGENKVYEEEQRPREEPVDSEPVHPPASDGAIPPPRISSLRYTRPKREHHTPPHIVEVLQYLRVIFDTEEVIDSVPLDVAANAGAWHAWRSHRSTTVSRGVAAGAASLSTENPTDSSHDSETSRERSMSPRQQPGGARRPGEWNWTGVWEDRVKKAVQASISESTLYGGDGSEVIGFVKLDDEVLGGVASTVEARAVAT